MGEFDADPWEKRSICVEIDWASLGIGLLVDHGWGGEMDFASSGVCPGVSVSQAGSAPRKRLPADLLRWLACSWLRATVRPLKAGFA